MKRKNPGFADKINHLRLRLEPIHPLPWGAPHPSFPKTLLHYHLLTEAELDSMAHFYSQSTPSRFTFSYPVAMGWDKEFLEDEELTQSERVAIKRRKLGKFIGLRGCETPVQEVARKIKRLERRLEAAVAEERKEKKHPHFRGL